MDHSLRESCSVSHMRNSCRSFTGGCHSKQPKYPERPHQIAFTPTNVRLSAIGTRASDHNTQSIPEHQADDVPWEFDN